MAPEAPERGRLNMVRFYGRLASQAPKAAWNALGHYANFALAALAVLFLVNRRLATAVSSWHGISPVWAVAPFVLFFVIGLLAANYNAFAAQGEPLPENGPELEIEEMIDSSLDPTILGNYSKIKIAKASKCEFKTDVPQPGSGEDPSL